MMLSSDMFRKWNASIRLINKVITSDTDLQLKKYLKLTVLAFLKIFIYNFQCSENRCPNPDIPQDGK